MAGVASHPALSAVWHPVQLKPREGAKNPIVSMNLPTGIHLRTWTFLRTSSAVCDFCSGPAQLSLPTTKSQNTLFRRNSVTLMGSENRDQSGRACANGKRGGVV